MTNAQLLQFIEVELNHNNEYKNAVAYLDDAFDGAENVRIVFYQKHRENYNKLLAFCAEHDGIIISTRPGTYSTIVRVEE